MKAFFEAAAWPMTQPQPYSAFHFVMLAAGFPAAWFLARLFAAWARSATRVLFGAGALLAAMELYKQGFLYFVENGGHYNWWYFPFQLCSVPMYLCLALPFFAGSRYYGVLTVFLQDFGLLGGILALLVPPGLMHPYWVMTLHGFVWHFILVFIGCFCAETGCAGRSMRAYRAALPLLFACCLLAEAINVAAGPTSGADLFYISPYYPSTQPVFRQIALSAGILPANLLYVAAMALGGAAVHLAVGWICGREDKSA